MLLLRRLLPLAAAVFAPLLASASDDPRLASWFTANSGCYARLYATTAAESSGTALTTWSRGQGTQSSPVYSDVHEINYSANWVYIRSANLPSHVMGPWYLNAAKTQLFGNYPANRADVFRIPRNPVIPGIKSATGAGSIGKAVNGVSFFDSRDLHSYSNANGQDSTPVNGLQGDGIWNRDGYYNEGVTFDPALAHQAGSQYHYHAQPIALRHQLGDNVSYNAATNRYSENPAAASKHSPILGWANDGLPIYGPYGYGSPLDPAGGVRRMISGYALRDGSNGTTAITVRQVLPAWARRFQNRNTLTTSQYGPAVSASYALGHYIEDYEYRGDLGQTQGVDFDLNEQNARWCVTPEYPNGTYAYFTTLKADGTPMYPYTTGRQFFGSPTGGITNLTTMNADTPLTRHFSGGPNKALAVSGTPTVNNGSVSVTWQAVEGATYAVAASTDASTYTTKATGLVATSDTRSTTFAALGKSGVEQVRITRTALATYDTNGFSAATVEQVATAEYSHPTPAAPAITTQPQSRTVNAGTSVTLSVVATGSAPLTYQWFKDDEPINGATSASLPLGAVNAGHAGSYHVVVSNAVGETPSQAAVLTVIVKPTVTTPPASQTVAVGAAVTFAVEASGTGPFTYQWRKGTTNLTGKIAATLTIDSATAADAGNYSVVVTNAAGSATSAAATLTVLAPPVVTNQPITRNATTGDTVTFTATASGAAPLSYRWFFGEEEISGATSATLTRASVTPAQSGDYFVLVSNAVGSHQALVASLVVKDPAPKPLILVPPQASSALWGAEIEFTVGTNATESTADRFRYQWLKDGKALEGRTDPVLALGPIDFADAALYSVRVTTDAGTATSAGARLTVLLPPLSALVLPEDVRVGTYLSAQLVAPPPLPVGLLYQASGLPAGLVLDPESGYLEGTVRGKPGSYRISYWTQLGKLKSEARQLTLEVGAFPSEWAGAYEVLLDDGQRPGGKVSFRVSGAGIVTGKVVTLGDSGVRSFRGLVSIEDGRATSRASISRGKKQAPYEIDLSIDPAGDVSAGVESENGEAYGGRGGFRLRGRGTNAFAGPAQRRYTMVIGASEDLGEDAPQGAGYAAGTLAGKNGALTLSGRLADRTKITGSFALGADNAYRVFFKPLARPGSGIGGSVLVHQAEDAAPAFSSAGWRWNRPALGGVALHPDGFSQVEVPVWLRHWSPPAKTAGALAASLELTVDTPFAVGFSGVDLETGSLPGELSLNAKGAIRVEASENPSAFRMKIAPATGLFSGSFKLADDTQRLRTVTFDGALLQPEANAAEAPRGQGHFIYASPAVPGLRESGLIEFDW
jgi:hypothetical protein